MLKQWLKFEERLNKRLAILFAAIKSLLLKLIPSSFFRVCKKLKSLSKNIYSNCHQKAIEFFLNSRDSLGYRKDQVFKFLTSIQNYNYKEKITKVTHAIVIFIKRSPKQHLQGIKSFIYFIVKKVENIINRFELNQIALTLMALILFAFGANLVINSSQNIWLQENQSRSPASIEDRRDRPDYYHLKEKTFVVLNIKIPVLVKGINKVTAVTIDFGVRTSNRFATLFLTEFEYKLKDHFFMTMHPIESSFPIEEEGKSVIKEKIQIELNKFLIEQNVEGTVEKVTIMYIIAT